MKNQYLDRIHQINEVCKSKNIQNRYLSYAYTNYVLKQIL